jgi:SAM-dependent methyltransferase
MSEFYEDLAPVYDSMIRWQRRLDFEAPLFDAIWAREKPARVLDAACGSGRHARLFAERGLEVVGTDASEAMVELARAHCADMPDATRPRLEVCPWDQLPTAIESRFDVVLCLGNSLPYETGETGLLRALTGLWTMVAERGLLLVQFKNFALLRERGERFLPLSSVADDDGETVCVRQYDWNPNGVDFQVIVLRRPVGGEWTMQHHVTPLRDWTPKQVGDALSAQGGAVNLLGSLAFEPFDVQTSADAIVAARRTY